MKGFAGCSFYAHLKIKGKVGGLMMRIAQTGVYSYAFTSKAASCFSSSHSAFSPQLYKTEAGKAKAREKVIGLKSGWTFPFVL